MSLAQFADAGGEGMLRELVRELLREVIREELAAALADVRGGEAHRGGGGAPFAGRATSAGTPTGAPAGARPGVASSAHHIERGAVTERAVNAAAADGARLVIGPRAVLTPLAKDRARVLGVVIERSSASVPSTQQSPSSPHRGSSDRS